jgi:tripartite-type tricarboxylate transporter receptor subunit TctC
MDPMLRTLALLIGVAGFAATPASAQAVADFYAGKQVHLLVGYPAGSGYDFAARVLAKHMSRHIPGHPTFVVENMVGAASLRVTNFLYAKAPRDGTYMASFGHEVLVAPLLQKGEASAQFDPSAFNWLGSMNETVTLGLAWARTGITSFREIFDREIVVGASPRGSDSYTAGTMLNKLLGTKLKIVTGYPGSNDIFLAGDRGEIDGYFGVSLTTLRTTQYDLVAANKINILMQIALEKEPTLPTVPLVTEFVNSAETRKALEIILAPYKAARPYAAPPGVPKDRALALSTAFAKTMKDPEFLNDAEKAKIDVSPMTGARIRELLTQIYASPPAAIAAARDALEMPP